MTEPLALWLDEPDLPREGVSKGALGWCGCGWRAFYGAYTATDASGRRVNETTAARSALERHAQQCPWRSE